VNDVHKQVAAIKSETALPVVVGFGVRSGEQARAIAQGADGVVVGSAVVSMIEKSLNSEGQATAATPKNVLELVQELSSALRAD
jgi:tryptophan synthase alpha chain